MTVSTGIAKPPKPTKSRNSKSWVQIQIKPKSQFEFVPRDIQKSESLDVVDVGELGILVEIAHMYESWHTNESCE